MEKFKQSFVELKETVSTMNERLTSLEGKKTNHKTVQYVCAETEFGEEPLSDYLDTCRIAVTECGTRNTGSALVEYYYYHCLNNGTLLPGSGSVTDIPPEKMAERYMTGKPSNDPMVSKIWDFAYSGKNNNHPVWKWVAKVYVDFVHEYTIQPHVSFYITPFNYDELGINSIKISELTTKMVCFEIEYGYKKCLPNSTPQLYGGNMDTKFTLHYRVQGPVKTAAENLLD